jgi:hypothetical protein
VTEARGREERIAVVNDVAAVIQKSVFDVGSIPRDLAHPGSVWRGDDSRDLDLTRLEVDHEEHEVPDETPPRDHFEGEEVRGDRSPMRLQEGLPARRSPSRGIDSILLPGFA